MLFDPEKSKVAFRVQGDTLFGEIVAIIEHKESARTFAVIEKYPQETISWLKVESSLYENHMVDFAALYKDRQYNSNGRPLERDFITVSLDSVGGQIQLVPFAHGEVSQQVKKTYFIHSSDYMLPELGVPYSQ